MATKKLEVLITGNAKGAQRAFGALEQSAGKSGKKTESALSGIAGHLADIGVAAAAFGAFSAWDESQRVAKQTEAVIASTGGAANVTAESVANLAGELSKKAGVDDEAIQSGQNLLLTFTKVRNEVGKGNDVFNQATEAALDMSVAMGTDMKSASMLVGKALNDPIKGMAALTRAGVQFTAQQKDQIRTMVESGDTLGAQKVILQELETQFGGSAEAQATSLGKAKVAVGNLAESIGGVLAPALEKGADLASAAADAFGKLSGGAQQAIVGGAGLAYAAARWGPALADAAGKAKHAGETIFTFGQLTAEAIRTRPEGVSRLAAAFDVVGAAAPNATAKVSGLVNAMGGLGVAVPVVGGALAIAGMALLEWADKAKKTKAEAAALRAEMEDGLSPIEAVNKRLANTLAGVEGGIENLGDSGRLFGRTMERMGISVEELQGILQMSDADFKAWRTEMQRSGGESAIFAEDVIGIRDAMKMAEKQTQDLEGAQKLLNVQTDETAASVGEAGEAVDDAAGSLKVMASRTEAAKAAADRYTQAQDNATESLRRFFDETTKSLSANIDAEAALDAVTESVKENGTSLDINTEKGRANYQSMIDMKDAAVEAAIAVREQGGSNTEAANTLRTYAARLAASAREAGYTEDQVEWLIATMKLTPRDIDTRFSNNAPSESTKVAGYVGTIGYVPPSKTTKFTADISQALYNIGVLQQKMANVGSGSMWVLGGQNSKPRAKGGPVSAGQPYLVGEEGPELIVPSASGTVMTAKQTRRIMENGTAGSMVGGGGGTVVNVYVAGSVLTERKLTDVVREGLIDVRRRTGRDPLAVA